MERPNCLKTSKFLFVFALLLLFYRCSPGPILDVNIPVPDNKWLHHNSAKVSFENKDSAAVYHLFFKIRNTSAYPYANLYVILHINGPSLSKTIRYPFKMAHKTGMWTGKGSGNLYSNTFILLKNFRFPATGVYTIDIEQNMQDDPLIGISDIGLVLSKAE